MKKEIDELEEKIPVFKSWRTKKNENVTINKKNKDRIYVQCDRLNTSKYPVFLSYKPLSLNKFYD
jgi:hypothetical protein